MRSPAKNPWDSPVRLCWPLATLLWRSELFIEELSVPILSREEEEEEEEEEEKAVSSVESMA